MKNGGKSQMAAGLMRKIAGDTVVVDSAGTQPGDHDQRALRAALLEVGVDITDQTPKPLTDDLIRAADRVVVLGRDARVQPADGTRSSTGTPTNPPTAASTGSNGCVWSATTSPAESNNSHSRSAMHQAPEFEQRQLGADDPPPGVLPGCVHQARIRQRLRCRGAAWSGRERERLRVLLADARAPGAVRWLSAGSPVSVSRRCWPTW